MSKMNYYLEKAKKNIIPRSLAQILPDAFGEWEWTGEVEKISPCESMDCELCGHSGLRKVFKIYNAYTGMVLWVGSCCVRKFISKHATKGILTPKEMASELRKAAVYTEGQKRKDRFWSTMNVATNSFRELSGESWMEGVRKGYSIKQMQYFYELFESCGFPYDFSDFTIRVRSEDTTDLYNFTPQEYRRYRLALPEVWRQELDSRFKLPGDH
jgi:hypothetical protein